MASDIQSAVADDDQTVEVESAPRKKRGNRADYTGGLGASCMLWGMVGGLGAMIAVILVWILSVGIADVIR